MSKRITALAAVVALAVIAAGCGDSGEEALTKAEFVKQADAICKEHDKQVQVDFQSYIEESKTPPKDEGAKLIETVFFPNIESEIEELRELVPPEGDEDQVTEMLDATEAGLEKAETEPDRILTLEANPFGDAKQLATDYGLKVCGVS